ncbi:MAG: hypothetical protein HY690_09085 [Chloroflexi bacterium]|nr:hypothetical protein [Chloroflexota bacterium]
MEEVLRIREELLGMDYRALIDAAVQARFAERPEDLLQAAEALREEVAGAGPGEYASAHLVWAKLRARTKRPTSGESSKVSRS